MSTAAEPVVTPPSQDSSEVEELLETLLSAHELTISGGDRTVRLPTDVRRVLVQAVSALAQGDAVVVAAQRTQLTTREVADLLGVSRPTAVRLLEDGAIPYTQPGRHRRVALADVLRYQEELERHRDTALAELANQEADPTFEGFIPTR